MAFIVVEKKTFAEVKAGEIFPHSRKYSSSYIDTFGIFINQVTERLIRAMNNFQFIQNGNIQMYILYGLIFIILVFAGTLFNFI